MLIKKIQKNQNQNQNPHLKYSKKKVTKVNRMTLMKKVLNIYLMKKFNINLFYFRKKAKFIIIQMMKDLRLESYLPIHQRKNIIR